MNRKDLNARVAEEAGLTAAQADAAVSAALGAVIGAVTAGDKVTLPGFGIFERKDRSARVGRNPSTGAAMEIAASKAPTFKPAAAFKRTVNEG